MAEYVWIDAAGGVRSKSRVRNNLYLPYLHRIADGPITRSLVVTEPAIRRPHAKTQTRTLFLSSPTAASALSRPSWRFRWRSGCPRQWLCSAVASAVALVVPATAVDREGSRPASRMRHCEQGRGSLAVSRAPDSGGLARSFCRLALSSGKPRDSAFTPTPHRRCDSA